MSTTLDIVIVNWNSGPQLRECLQSISGCDRTSFRLGRVIVVDNASMDGSADGLDDLDLPITVLRNLKNRGFAGGCNQGAEQASGDLILFLNPDTILEPDSLEIPVSFMTSNDSRNVGICGIQLTNSEGRVTPTCARFPTVRSFTAKILGLNRLFPTAFPSELMTEWDHQSDREVDQIMGAFLMIRSSIFTQLQGFDERFFVYFEEVDLSARMSHLGYSSYFVSRARATHRGCGTTDQIRATRLVYNIRSRLLYAAKHYSFAETLLLTLLTLGVEPLSRVLLGLFAPSNGQIKDSLMGFSHIYRNLPSLVKEMIAIASGPDVLRIER